MGFSKISADADLKGGVWHILPSGEHREWSPLGFDVLSGVHIIRTRWTQSTIWDCCSRRSREETMVQSRTGRKIM